jgi:hypothetical protein
MVRHREEIAKDNKTKRHIAKEKKMAEHRRE